MILSEFITRLREDFLEDTIEPYFWSDDTLIRYANDAEKEACIRAHLLIDSSTDSVCVLNVTAGTSSYQLNSKVISILSAYNETLNYPIYQLPKVSVDSMLPNWRSLESEAPKYFIIDEVHSTTTLTIIPKPTIDFSVRFTVNRLPLVNKSITDSFEIPEIYHNDLLYWAAFLALSKQDVDTNKRDEARRYEDKFEQMFGKRKSAYTEINNIRNSRLQSIRPASRKAGFR